ncbi:hypothetical protein PVAND_017096 [Polypedilum vanderplanki]|uniref:Uncharacterized protein n=1 Tax=Polypedilum vanderplanki TaxID=319348 RepID=A0A9J6BI48_POLVA|nr:hypothetical protein PVAND_017096 [Polypedilum vanderplanki]
MRVKNFLCCFKIESGGIIIGFLGLAISSIGLFTHTFILFSLMAVGKFCPEQRRNYETYRYERSNSFYDNCSELSAIPFGIYLVVAICFNIISIIAHFRLMKAVEHIDSSRLNLSIVYYKFWIIIKLIFIVIFIILTVFLFFIMLLPIFVLILLLLIDVYTLAVIESIRFKFDNLPTMTVTYTPQTC